LEDAEYKKWFASQQSHLAKNPGLLSFVPANLLEEAKKFVPAEATAAPAATPTDSTSAAPTDSTGKETPKAEASVAAPAPAAAQVDLKEGEQLFRTTCVACHQITEAKLVGPGLKNVDKRRSQDWLVKFIKNSQSLVQAGDKQAVEVFNQFNKIPMPNHDYSDAQVLNIIAYIKSESSK
jgi:mono/diheme cytochrome c family protein